MTYVRGEPTNMKTAALIFTVLLSTFVSAQAQEPTTGYAPVNGLKMYYEIHGTGSGEPLVLLHGSFMTISSNWTEWIGEFSKTRKGRRNAGPRTHGRHQPRFQL
jgi:hypothetical protein